jgi:DNA (cytosine-5)-methyltransferase 1
VTFGSLFAGIGGMDLGLERAGMTCKWQVEIDPWCQAVLGRDWPTTPRYGDIREITGEELERVDLIAGGFPCQDVSNAGRQAGITGVRSGLWKHYIKIVRVLRPKFVLVENVPGLVTHGWVGSVLGDLAENGFNAEWDIAGADVFIGASQHRERVWILAYPHNTGFQGPIWAGQPNPAGQKWTPAYREPLRSDCGLWPPGPLAVADVPRMADGPADRAHRLKALGNAVVPQVAEWIGRSIMAAVEGV